MSELRAPLYLAAARELPELALSVRGQPIITLSADVCALVEGIIGRYQWRMEDIEKLAPPPFTSGVVEWAADPIDSKPLVMFAESEYRRHAVFLTRSRGPLSFALLTSFYDGRLVWDSARLNGPEVAYRETYPGIAAGAHKHAAEYWSEWWIATCAVLAAPGVRSTNETRKEKRLQRARGEAAPIVTYRCVDIDIDALAGIPEDSSGGGGTGRVGVALHHVRGHLRLVEKRDGPALIPIRPHWRGEAKYGTRLRDRNMMRNEEMHREH